MSDSSKQKLVDSPVVPYLFDTRVRLRSLSRGLITQDELKKFQTSLPDESEHAVFLDYNKIVKDEDSGAASGGSTH